jgi:hypothetical protein
MILEKHFITILQKISTIANPIEQLNKDKNNKIAATRQVSIQSPTNMPHPKGISTGFESKDKNLDNCIQNLTITLKKQDLEEIELDIAEIKVQSVSYSYTIDVLQ